MFLNENKYNANMAKIKLKLFLNIIKIFLKFNYFQES